MCACTGIDEDTTKIVLTTGFEKDEIFRIEDMSCTLPEMMVYLTNIQEQYENVYGKQIWDTTIDGVSLEDNIKDMALSKMAQVKAINLLARDYNVEIDEQDQAAIIKATDAYYSSLNPAEIEAMGIDKEVIRELYREYAISEKLYEYVIRDINPEISDDEARTITVDHILIKTYTLDENGEKQHFSDYAKKQAYAKAEELLERARNGEDFGKLAMDYSDDTQITYSFGKGRMDPVFENASFNLGKGEISDIVETEYGYHIIKCITTFNKEETDANKLKIVDIRRNEAFSKEYDEYVSTLTKNLNSDLWEQVKFIDDERVTTSSFFEVFDEYWER